MHKKARFLAETGFQRRPRGKPARDSFNSEVIPERQEQQKEHDGGPEILRDAGEGNGVRNHGLETGR